MSVSKELSCEAESFSCCLHPHRFFQSEILRLYFPALGPWVTPSVSPPSCSSWFIQLQMWDSQLCQPPLFLVYQSLCCNSSPLQLPCCASPAGLDECSFFSSLFVELPYSLIFWQFCFFFFFKFVVVLLLVVLG